jgi:hypothetical protein
MNGDPKIFFALNLLYIQALWEYTVSLVKSLFFRPLYLIVVRSLTDIKNNFVRSYPEKRTGDKIGKEGAQSARVRRAAFFLLKTI